MKTPCFLTDARLRLLLFGGKGGVGKTTCASATALHWAAESPDASILLLSTDPAHSLADSFGGFAPPRNLEIMELDAQECLAEFKLEHGQTLQQITLRGTFLDEEDISQFLDLSLPGMDELMAMLVISKWVENAHYDRIIVDTAPTGHTLRLLEMPQLIRKWLRGLDSLLAKHRYMKMVLRGSYQTDELDHFLMGLSDTVSRMRALLQDRVRCCFVPVMLAERLSIHETTGLLDRLEDMQIPVVDIIVNRLLSPGSCPLCADLHSIQSRELQTIANRKPISRYSLWGVPLYQTEVVGIRNLNTFWKHLTKIPRRVPARAQSAVAPLLPIDPTKCDLTETTLLLFAGKGGVGKTTLACATALHMAAGHDGKEVFLFSTDPAHSLSACLDCKAGPRPVRIAPRLTVMEIDAQAEFEALKMQYGEDLRRFMESAFTSFELTFDREVMERILDLSPPGIDEVFALSRAVEFLTARKYDIFVLDSAPTGHLIRLLELPELVERWLKVFFGLFLKYRTVFRLPKVSQRLVGISKELKHLRSLLTDPARSAMVVVSILTEMALQETSDLIGACSKMGIDVPLLFLNLVIPLSDCPACSPLHRGQMRVRDKFHRKFPDKDQVIIYRQGHLRGLQRLSDLGSAIYRVAADESSMCT